MLPRRLGKTIPKKRRSGQVIIFGRNVDRALLTGASEVEVMMAKQSQIDEPVAESLREHGQNPKLFTGILQKAVGYLRGFVEFLRETKYCDRDSEGNPLIDHDMRIDITPEPLPAKPKGKRPSSEKQEAEVMRLQQILNKMKKQEQKIYAIEKGIMKLEKDLKEVKKKWFHKKEQKEPESEKMYLRIPANIPNVEKQEIQKSNGQKKSIHERLEEKKRQGQNVDYVRQRKIHNRDCL